VLVPRKLPAQPHRRTSIWTTREIAAKTDSEAKFRLSYEQPAMWHVMNMHRKNALGYPVGYMIHPHGNSSMVMDPGDPAFSRALFANYHLWVTPYVAAERYAAGDYPNQSGPGQGLPAWTSNAREITDRDLVLWYTIGFHHVPSAEDWPVYSLAWHAVTLTPYNFFDRNPALDLPPPE
jgi:primary-amine oxidase